MRPTQALSVGRYRHIAITTKDVGRGFYKGNRTGSMGRHTKYGGYVIEWNKVRTYVVPQNLQDFKVSTAQQQTKKGILEVWRALAANAWFFRQLTPFVSREIKSAKGDYQGLQKGPQDPYFYVEQWKRYNGVD